MDNTKMGQFIAALRKSKSMTQKDLAERLTVSDKAVSKWERGLSCPDISLLSELAEILGVSVSELPNGEKNEETSDELKASVNNALQYADKTVKKQNSRLRNIFAAAFSALCLMGIIVCAICDLAISKSFTWSLFPISSVIFAWLVFFPALKFEKNGILFGLISLTALIVPFLYILSLLVNVEQNALIMPIGVRMSAISLIYLWTVFLLFRKIKSKLLAGGFSLLLAVPVIFWINFCLFKMLPTTFIDIWDILTLAVIGSVSAGLISAHYNRK